MAFTGGTIYTSPTDEPIRNGVVLIRDGKIAAAGEATSVKIPSGTRTIDCSGLTITAGFWNSHVHFIERKWSKAGDIPASELAAELQAMLTRYGVTSAFDTGSMWANTRKLRDRIESGEVPGPRIRSAGEIIYPKNAFSESVPSIPDALGFMRMQSPEAGNSSEALTAAKQMLDAGTDAIKLYAATWFPPFAAMPQSALEAAANEAHRRGKLVFAHPTNREGLLASVRGGADIIVHTAPQSGPWNAEILAAMKEKRVALIPTLKLWTYELRHDRISQRERFVEMGVGQLRSWVAAGGVVLFGTDVGYMSDYDPSDEFALMAKAGMSFRQILTSLTTAPAERFGESKQLGRIVPGMIADLAVVDGDPSKDIRTLASVRYTLRAGKLIYSRSH